MADPNELPLAEAVDVIRGVTRERLKEARAFEKMELALATAVNVQNRIARLTREQAVLAADVEDLGHQKGDLLREVEEAKSTAAGAIQQAKANAIDRETTLRAETKTLEDQLTALRETLATESRDGELAAARRVDDVQKKCGLVLTEHDRRVRILEGRAAQAEARLKATRDNFNSLVEHAQKTAEQAP